MGRILGLLLGLFILQPCFGEVTGITSNPSAPLMGEMVTYSLINDGMDDIASVKWEYKYAAACAANDPWIEDTSQTGEQASWGEHRPGTWNIRVTVTYNPNSGGGPPHAPTLITQAVTIAPATKFTFAGGFNTVANLGDPIILQFQVEGADRPCGSFIGANLIQEKITNRTNPVPPFGGPLNPVNDTDFGPPQSDPLFHLNQNIIVDEKGYNPPLSSWDQLAIGQVAYEADQEMRIRYQDPCGTFQYINLGTFHFKRVKVSAYEWKIVTQ